MTHAELRNKYFKPVEQYLGDYLNSEPSTACARMTAYQLKTGGKRLRALIPCYVFQELGHDPKHAIPLGAAIEMIHNATLVHDDLQDGDEVRRDQPTVWKKYSEEQSINCGDAMFQYALQILLHLETDHIKKVLNRAIRCTINVIEGQAQEFLMKDEEFPKVERYFEVIRGKTSGLFSLPVVGAMEALGFNNQSCEVAEKAANDLGMLFQIQDDLLDLYGEKGRGQKATDIAEGKISFFIAHVNEVGSLEDKIKLSQILKKPRQETTSVDIDCGLEILNKYKAKEAAIHKIRAIQNDLRSSELLENLPEIKKILLNLSDQFLEPVYAIL